MDTLKFKIDKYTFVMGVSILIAVVVAIFLPTSNEKEIYGVDRLVFVWAILLFVIALIRINNHIDSRQAALSMLGINIYMLLVTIVAGIQFGGARFSLARIAPVIVLIYLFSLRIQNYPSYRFMKLLLNIVSITAIIWNISIMFEVQSVIDFTYNLFNQYYDLNGYYQLVVGHKPVMSFGVHTYAAYYYFLLFLLCFATYKFENKKLYLYYAVIYTIFNLFLVSTTAIIFFVMMAIFLAKEITRGMELKGFFLLMLISILLIVIVAMNFDVLYEKLYTNFTNGNNSFISRYSSDSVFTTNFKLITSSLGIGYNIVDGLDIGYSDSGYMVYMTMGNIPFTVAIYYFLYKFLYANLTIYRKVIMIVVFSFEVALPATFNYRFSYMILFVICYLGALDTYTQEIDY